MNGKHFELLLLSNQFVYRFHSAVYLLSSEEMSFINTKNWKRLTCTVKKGPHFSIHSGIAHAGVWKTKRKWQGQGQCQCLGDATCQYVIMRIVCFGSYNFFWLFTLFEELFVRVCYAHSIRFIVFCRYEKNIDKHWR